MTGSLEWRWQSKVSDHFSGRRTSFLTGTNMNWRWQVRPKDAPRQHVSAHRQMFGSLLSYVTDQRVCSICGPSELQSGMQVVTV
jgi:hypothetical protein